MIGNRQIRRIIVLAICILLPALYGWGQNVTSKKKVQRGKATYYSRRATGSHTSSGDRLHHDSLTCAHRTYPFGTKLKVTNPANGKFVVVTVTDRGPYGKGKIIDLTYRAAKEIGILSKGVASVIVEEYDDIVFPTYLPGKGYKFQEFDFAEVYRDSANALQPQWQRELPTPAVKPTAKAKPTQKEVSDKTTSPTASHAKQPTTVHQNKPTSATHTQQSKQTSATHTQQSKPTSKMQSLFDLLTSSMKSQQEK